MQDRQYADMYNHEKKHWWFRGKRAYLSTMLKLTDLHNANILDIGCGTGFTTKFLDRFGFVTGIEQNKKAWFYAKKNKVTVINRSANSLPFHANIFDCVTILDVLYHKQINEKVVLSEARRVLKKNSWLLITDCAHQSLFGEHDRVMQARIRFNKKGLEWTVKDAGFTIIRSSYIFASTFPLFVISRILLRNKKATHYVSSPHKYINAILYACIRIESKILAYFNLPFGSSIIILAQKK
ncbi:MAG: class I SAM-dependent methyltransferase [Candidatus Roizmanbacteria bacterium]|nr:class I SAM-dependent methyltransferase [Candidatus Roizmanbacteria bacterium]